MKTSFASLEQRIANQTRRLNQGVRAGTLTTDEASGLRERLSSAQKLIQNDAFDGNGSSRLQEQRKLLHGIGSDMRTAARNDVIDPAKRTENITRRIENGLADGSLTQEEHDALKAKIEGAQTPEQLRALSREVRAERHDGELDAQKRVANFQKRIDAGTADGSLTADEAKALQERVTQLGQNPDAAAVNQLNRDIFVQRHNRNVDGTAMTTALGQRIDTLEQSGKLTPDQASAFRAQLEELKRDGAEALGPRLNILREQLRAA